MLQKIADRIKYFQKTYAVAGIMDGLATIKDRAVRVGDRIEECVVTEVAADRVTLKGVLGGDGRSEIECTTFDVAGRPVASVAGVVLHVGDKYKGCTVGAIGQGRMVLQQDGAQGAAGAGAAPSSQLP